MHIRAEFPGVVIMKDLNYLQKKQKQIRKQLDEAHEQQNREKMMEAAKSLIRLTFELLEK